VELLGEDALPSEPATSEADKLFARVADDASLGWLTAAVERSPKDVARRWQRGDWHAQRGRWQEAVADYQVALEGDPADAGWWLHAAPALVAAGDRDGYRRLCRGVLQRFGETQDPPTADGTAKACLLLPDTDQETERACRLADRAATLGKDHAWAAYFIFCKGLADYRRGDSRAAVAGLDPLVPRTASIPPLAAECHLVLEMALHRQGETEAAREHLARGAKLLQERLGDPARFSMSQSEYHHDWLIAWLLGREARALIEGEEAGPQK
jgi:tetratricopeptide (TPR) repeat protein